MITPGHRLYERYRRHEVDAEAWPWLDQEVREFWEKLATEVIRPW